MGKLLAELKSPLDLHRMTVRQLEQLAAEIRQVLCQLLSYRSAHFASNLGVVELCLALHSVYDFRRDRLIWDTGHQIYPHKLITGRYAQFHTIRTKGGLMGYPNPQESPYDLFMTGHAGCSVSTILGLHTADTLLGEKDRRAVAVIGDGAFPSGIVQEALNNAGGMAAQILVILNDNKMSICPRVGGLAQYLDRLRTNPLYTGFKSEVQKLLNRVPVFGDPTERVLIQLKEAVKAGLHGGMLFEELGFRYLGPIDGHNLALLRKYLRMVKDLPGPILLHVVTEKGHGYQPAAADPVFFHAPPPFESKEGRPVPKEKTSGWSFTHHASKAIFDQMAVDRRVTVMTAAMCQGNKLEKVRDTFPDRFFDTGICESHTVAFAAGQAKAGLRPIVDIYSTFLQRSFDQIFQEVSLQNLPVLFMMDRAGLAGPDGPTHHGVFDIAYLRIFPHLTLMAPADGRELQEMVAFALQLDGPAAIRYPKATAPESDRPWVPLERGKAEIVIDGSDGAILSYGALLAEALRAAEQLEQRHGLRVAVVNARFAKPLDTQLLSRLIHQVPFLITLEEGCLAGGFGSAVLEWAAEQSEELPKIRRLGIPDQYVMHAERHELLADLGLNAEGIVRACLELSCLQCQE
ncbi:MAG: 1-deoxy-D-xylulose-5-phosphate synthase [Pirellulaceae bacterium]|nr:MAG: 1-deoxy-D-xylulose-5-phosphate synthase [Pirellulaceae bacterium]GIW93786.1 MAG: 1-deoxy-D-xylulose-5-phosphate synthase [Pirellulaceae bacterium]